MRYLLIVLVWLFFIKTAIGQCDSTLIGKWKVVAVLNGGTYFNLKTDSIHFSSLMAMYYPTDSSKREFLALQKEMYKDALFHFKNDSSLNARMVDDYAENVRYCFKRSENIIKLMPDGKSGKKIINNQTAIVKNGLLHITISPPEMKDYIFEIMLERSAEH